MYAHTNEIVKYIHIQNDTDRYDKVAHPVGRRAVLSCTEHVTCPLQLFSCVNINNSDWKGHQTIHAMPFQRETEHMVRLQLSHTGIYMQIHADMNIYLRIHTYTNIYMIICMYMYV